MLSFKTHLEKLDEENSFYVKIECLDGTIICSSLVGKIKNDSASICKIDTLKKYQFQGIGRELVKEFEYIAQEKYCKQIDLISSSEDSDKFWNKIEDFVRVDDSRFFKTLVKDHD